MKYVPTKEDCQRIKEAASKEASPRVSVGAVLLEPALRGNINVDGVEPNMNIALVTKSGNWKEWSDTDLYDYGTWAAFRKGIELTPFGGFGIVDFYIRKRNDEYGDLLGNVTIEIENGKLTRIYGYGNKEDYK